MPGLLSCPSLLLSAARIRRKGPNTVRAVSTSSGGSTGTGGASTGGSTGDGGRRGHGGSERRGGSGSTEGGTGGSAGGGGVMGHPDPNGTYPTHEGFSLYLVEEFEQPIDVKTDPVWTYSDGALDEGDVRFTPEGISFSGGKMVITVSKMDVPGSHSYAENKDVFQKPLRSGELRTKFNNFRYGRYEVRLKAPNQSGNYINTMFAFRTPKYQDWRELDLEVTADAPTSFTTNVIYGDKQQAWSAGYRRGVGGLSHGARRVPGAASSTTEPISTPTPSSGPPVSSSGTSTMSSFASKRTRLARTCCRCPRSRPRS